MDVGSKQEEELQIDDCKMQIAIFFLASDRPSPLADFNVTKPTGAPVDGACSTGAPV
jgi:hypothetical protein